MNRFILVLLVAGGCLLPACGDDAEGTEPHSQAEDTGTPDADLDTGESEPDPFELELEWQPCPLSAGQNQTFMAECATTQLPLNWEDKDNGATIEYFVRRVEAPQPSGRSIWLLSGGPGFSGLELEGYAPWLQYLDPTLTVYIPDHRGTGRSSRLSCPTFETVGTPDEAAIADEEWPGCVEELVETWGEDLEFFSTTQAAMDVRGLIDATTPEGEDVYVFGNSYGTYLAARYLQVAPEQATAVVMDSIAPHRATFISEQDHWTNLAARDIFFPACDADATCSEKLGGDSWAKLEELYVALDEGHCQEVQDFGVTIPLLRATFVSIIGSMALRPFAPALIYRYLRCEDGDIAAITHLFSGSEPSYPTVPSAYSPLLGDNIALSELWEPDDPSLEEVIERDETQHLSRGVAIYVAQQRERWPTYPHDAFVTGPIESETPLLMLAGGLDLLTPLPMQELARNEVAGEHQHFVTFPYAVHGVTSSTQVPGRANHDTCGMEVMLKFLADPRGPLDTACVDLSEPIDFSGNNPFTQNFFGTDDLWE